MWDDFPHVIESQQFFSAQSLLSIFQMADLMQHKQHTYGLSNKVMLTLFYEPSTRTRFSFEMAMMRLGGRVLTSENAKEFSSAIKGEKLEDTIRVLCGYKPDIIVLRYHEEGGAVRARRISTVPIINAGDGKGQHPTQALLDVYTIYKKLGRMENFSIAMVGDLENGRTARSLSYLLGKFPGIKIYFVAPEHAQMKDDVRDYLERHDVRFYDAQDIRNVAPKVDVIYQTRTQTERGSSLALADESGFFKINKTVLKEMKKDAIIMHPLPRVNEISPEVDEDPRAVYFEQSDNGLAIRMALIKIILTP